MLEEINNVLDNVQQPVVMGSKYRGRGILQLFLQDCHLWSVLKEKSVSELVSCTFWKESNPKMNDVNLYEGLNCCLKKALNK